MAVVRFGDGGPVFGLTTETTGFVQEFRVNEMYDEAEVPNEVGEILAYAMFNKRWEGSYVLVDKSGASIPSTATAVAIANLTEASKAVITARERTPEQKGFQKYTLQFKAWANITLS
jgi:hypothetical protein